ncbi:MAG: hypothetical protein JWP22_3178 [Ramlibacter sp.]|nr:hypothetical protein [Ramlibacter sp.]
MASSNQNIGVQRITGRSFTSMDPERQREIVVESPAAGTPQERRFQALRNSRPPHLAWMAPEADVSEGGSNRRR